MEFNKIESLKEEGFTGFTKITHLYENPSRIPDEKGIYLVAYIGDGKPKFIKPGVGGFFKGKDPNVSLAELENNWVNDTVVIYIGQAGGRGSKQTLRKRIKQYISFGHGKRVGHWGGRLIWQIENSRELLICWKTTAQDPREIEENLILEFVKVYTKRPFANLSN